MAAHGLGGVGLHHAAAGFALGVQGLEGISWHGAIIVRDCLVNVGRVPRPRRTLTACGHSCRIYSCRSLKRCSLPVSVRGRLAHELDLARVLERRDAGLHVVLQRLDHRGVAGVARLEHAEGLDDHAALLVGLADHAALGHGRVPQQRVLDFRAADVVAGGDDHVVGAGLVEEVAVLVLHEGVAGVVPAVLHVVGLARVVQVLAAGGADHGQLADRAARHFVAVVVDHLGRVAGHHLADGAGAHVAAGRGDEDVEHLGGADAVQHLDAGRLLPQLARRVGQALRRR